VRGRRLGQRWRSRRTRRSWRQHRLLWLRRHRRLRCSCCYCCWWWWWCRQLWRDGIDWRRRRWPWRRDVVALWLNRVDTPLSCSSIQLVTWHATARSTVPQGKRRRVQDCARQVVDHHLASSQWHEPSPTRPTAAAAASVLDTVIARRTNSAARVAPRCARSTARLSTWSHVRRAHRVASPSRRRLMTYW